LKKLFINYDNCKIGDSVFITGDDYYHLAKVYRVKAGEQFIIGDISNNEYYGEVIKIGKDKISIIMKEYYKREIVKKPIITIFFSILKGDKNELLIQKCTEIGVDRFVPVKTKNSIPDIKNMSNKISRWKKILKEASMQSCREKIPGLNDVILFENIFNYSYNTNEKKFFGYISEEARNFFDVIKGNNDLNFISLFVGPEGDFSNDEMNLLKKNGWEGVYLSPYIFKSETAAIYFSSILFFNYCKLK
jgi:16S rRNA (uracil1498-N3)-methyltransferase